MRARSSASARGTRSRCQTIADKLFEADSAADPSTEGYVPRSTLGYMSDCVDLVQYWIRRARIAQSDPASRGEVAGAAADLARDEPTRRASCRASARPMRRCRPASRLR